MEDRTDTQTHGYRKAGVRCTLMELQQPGTWALSLPTTQKWGLSWSEKRSLQAAASGCKHLGRGTAHVCTHWSIIGKHSYLTHYGGGLAIFPWVWSLGPWHGQLKSNSIHSLRTSLPPYNYTAKLVIGLKDLMAFWPHVYCKGHENGDTRQLQRTTNHLSLREGSMGFAAFPLPSWLLSWGGGSYFHSCCSDKITSKKQLREERF